EPEEETTPPSPTTLDGGSRTLDADRPDRATPQLPEPETCSAAGWCVVQPPAYGSYVFVFAGLWPTAGHAFAYGRSLTPDQSAMPATVQDWDYETQTWTRIDDGRHQSEQGGIASIWAPNADEVYYTSFQFGVVGAEVHHGKRPTPPEIAWSWTTHTLGCNVRFHAALWGSGADDVYAVGCKKIFHRSPNAAEGGTEAWIEEVVEASPSDDFLGIDGSGPDDVWIYGKKTNCPYVLRKTRGDFERIAEGVYIGGQCEPRDGLITFDQYLHPTRPPIFVPRRGELVVLRSDGKQIARIRETAGGAYAAEFASPLPAVPPLQLVQAWGSGDDSLWFLTSDDNSLRATNVWSDAGAKLEYSTLVRNGAPNDEQLTIIRGPSTDNLWAAGANRAFHKSTP
ncbi:MAG: hypothetical protein K0S65_6372, partial [Labilithrix sp.]|nr:hypothetical protein [Labilithrix sp.]